MYVGAIVWQEPSSQCLVATIPVRQYNNKPSMIAALSIYFAIRMLHNVNILHTSIIIYPLFRHKEYDCHEVTDLVPLANFPMVPELQIRSKAVPLQISFLLSLWTPPPANSLILVLTPYTSLLHLPPLFLPHSLHWHCIGHNSSKTKDKMDLFMP